MKYILFLMMMLASQSFASSSEKEAKKLAKELLPFSLENSHVDPDQLKPKKAGVFDSKQAKKSCLAGEESKDRLPEIVDRSIENQERNKSFHEDEAFLKFSEEAYNSEEGSYFSVEEKEVTEVKKCRMGGDPYAISLVRTLHIDAEIDQEEVNRKICKGHKDYKKCFWKKDAKELKKKKEKKLSDDESVSWYSVKIKEGGVASKYKVAWKYTHKDDTKECYSYTTETEESRKLKISREEWTYEDEDKKRLISSPQCTFLSSICLDDRTKKIHGEEITRQCWKEKLNFICSSSQKDECSFLKNRNCKEIGRRCLKKSDFGCSLWELEFRCISGKKHLISLGKEGFFIPEIESDEEPCQTFPEISAKLAVFDAIKEEIESTKTLDASKISVFSGKKLSCEKSVASDVLFDCCFSMKGFATKVDLAKCNAKEILLAEQNEAGKCHYLGSYEEKVLGVKKSDKHVFCCFSSKLAKVFLEQAKKQLGISWGDAKNPDCSGIPVETITQIDFSKVDLSEVFEETLKRKEGFEKRLEAFQKKIAREMEK